eukprot:7229138-Alexandrium_andersonii.AAC.1
MRSRGRCRAGNGLVSGLSWGLVSRYGAHASTSNGLQSAGPHTSPMMLRCPVERARTRCYQDRGLRGPGVVVNAGPPTPVSSSRGRPRTRTR